MNKTPKFTLTFLVFVGIFLQNNCAQTIKTTTKNGVTTTVTTGVPKMAGEVAGSKTMLTASELTMLDEVNFCRTEPKKYAALIAVHLKELERGAPIERVPVVTTSTTIEKGVKKVRRDTTWEGGGFDKKMIDKAYIAAGRECIAQLEKMKPLAPLTHVECLYNAAKIQGLYCKKMKKLGHTGENGSGPWDRIPKACGDKMPNGAENLGAGAPSVRVALFHLLVDARVPERGHRKNLLNPVTKYIGIYHIGTIDGMNNSFIQTFGW